MTEAQSRCSPASGPPPPAYSRGGAGPWSPPCSSGCAGRSRWCNISAWAVRPTAAHRWCRRWRRRRSRGGGRCPAWAECRAATSPGSSYLAWQSVRITAVSRSFELLGILLIALRGLRTLTVLMAERFNFSTSKQYSRALGKYTGQLFLSWSYNSFIFIFKTLLLLKISDERKPKIKGQNYRTSHSTILKYFHHEETQF